MRHAMQGRPRDVWVAGEGYEHHVGQWSRFVASRFLAWLAPAPNLRWLDVGCGSGALTQSILAHSSPREVVGIDPSEEFISYARTNTCDQRAAFETDDARDLHQDDWAFDAAVAGLVLNFVPDPVMALTEMIRVVRPGGTVAAYIWDYAEGMQMMRVFWDEAMKLDPFAQNLDEGRRFPVCQPQQLRALFDDARLERTDISEIVIPTTFRNFDDYWSPFLLGEGPAPSYCTTLSEGQRNQLRDRLRAALPIDPDGAIRLRARAYAARGLTPS